MRQPWATSLLATSRPIPDVAPMMIAVFTLQIYEKSWLRQLISYPRSESNRDQRNRNPLFYPLNYRGILFWDCKIIQFFGNI